MHIHNSTLELKLVPVAVAEHLSVICEVPFYKLDLLVPSFLFIYLPSATSEIAESVGVESCDMKKCLNHQNVEL